MSDSLPDDAVLNTHTEQLQMFCANCWVSETVEHADHAEVHHRVVTGKLCVPGTMSAEETRECLDALLTGQDTARLSFPICRLCWVTQHAQKLSGWRAVRFEAREINFTNPASRRCSTFSAQAY